MGEGFVDRDVARLAILDKEDNVRDAVEKLNSRKRTSQGRGESRGNVVMSDDRRR